jgi:hypothetical protein
MTSAFAYLGAIRTAEGGIRAARELSAPGRAVDWFNSPPLTPERYHWACCSFKSHEEPAHCADLWTVGACSGSSDWAHSRDGR